MYKKQVAIEELTNVLTSLSIEKINQLKEIAINMSPDQTISTETAKSATTEENNTPKGIDLSVLSREGLIKTIDGIRFVFPTKTGIANAGLSIPDFKFSSENMLYYDGKNTNSYAYEIARKFKCEPTQIYLPIRSQATSIYSDPKLRNNLLAKNIYWIPYITDKKNQDRDEDRNVSLAELFKEPDKYIFTVMNVQENAWRRVIRTSPFDNQNEMVAAIFGTRE